MSDLLPTLPIEYEGKTDENSIDITEITDGLVDIFELSNFTTDTNNKYTIDVKDFKYDGLIYSYTHNTEIKFAKYKKKMDCLLVK